jgi:serine/threonine-protein kinase PRP4
VDRVRLCDFGSSLLEDEVVTTCELVSRFYRAPEIILGHPYDSKVDIWSLGCTLFEIFTGQILFQGRSNNEMLKLIMQVKGPIPSRIIKKGLYSGQYFNDQGDFLSMEVDYSNKKEYMKDLKVSSFPSKDLMSILKNFSSSEDLKSLLSFKDFLEKCLHLDPKKRVTALEALTHEFIGIIPIGSYSK